MLIEIYNTSKCHVDLSTTIRCYYLGRLVFVWALIFWLVNISGITTEHVEMYNLRTFPTYSAEVTFQVLVLILVVIVRI